jgi:hypothetical protein
VRMVDSFASGMMLRLSLGSCTPTATRDDKKSQGRR